MFDAMYAWTRHSYFYESVQMRLSIPDGIGWSIIWTSQFGSQLGDLLNTIGDNIEAVS